MAMVERVRRKEQIEDVEKVSTEMLSIPRPRKVKIISRSNVIVRGKNGGARPGSGASNLMMNLGEFQALCEIQATQVEIAAFFKLSIPTVNKLMQQEPYKSIRAEGLGMGKVSIRRQMFTHSVLPNSAGVNATIHLSKHYLGQTDKSALELYGNVDKPLTFVFARAEEKI